MQQINVDVFLNSIDMYVHIYTVKGNVVTLKYFLLVLISVR